MQNMTNREAKQFFGHIWGCSTELVKNLDETRVGGETSHFIETLQARSEHYFGKFSLNHLKDEDEAKEVPSLRQLLDDLNRPDPR